MIWKSRLSNLWFPSRVEYWPLVALAQQKCLHGTTASDGGGGRCYSWSSLHRNCTSQLKWHKGRQYPGHRHSRIGSRDLDAMLELGPRGRLPLSPPTSQSSVAAPGWSLKKQLRIFKFQCYLEVSKPQMPVRITARVLFAVLMRFLELE